MKRTVPVIGIILILLLSSICISTTHGHQSISNSSPVVRILEPEDGSVHYTRFINITFNATDDTGMQYLEIDVISEFGSENHYLSYVLPTKYIEHTKSRKLYPGWNTIIVTAFDLENNSGNKTINVYYNTSFDKYDPFVWIAEPFNGITIFGKRILPNIEVPIVIGGFFFTVHAFDHEDHLATVVLYLDDEEIYREESNNEGSFINYNYQGFLIGFHTIKAEVFDTFGNSAFDEKECFVINLR